MESVTEKRVSKRAAATTIFGILIRFISKLSLALCLVFPPTINAQDSDPPERGTVADIKDLRRVYVDAEDEDSYQLLVKALGKYKGLDIVESPKSADFILEYRNLTRDVAPGRRAASMAKKSQMRAIVRRDSVKIIAWAETETLDVSDGFTMSKPNETNLALNFIKTLKKARGEKR